MTVQPDSSFQDVMAQLRAGDPAAAAIVFERFAQRLIALARSRLDSLTLRKIDPEDVLQSVFRSFFARQADGQFTLRNWESLWAMLVVITLRKCGRQMGYYRAARRNLRREITFTHDSAGTGLTQQGLDAEPTPAEAAVLSDLLEQLVLRAGDSDRPIIALALQGFTASEIGDRVGCTERTVRRVLARAREKLGKLQE